MVLNCSIPIMAFYGAEAKDVHCHRFNGDASDLHSKLCQQVSCCCWVGGGEEEEAARRQGVSRHDGENSGRFHSPRASVREYRICAGEH